MKYGTLSNYIGGEWVQSQTTQMIDRLSPLTGAVLSRAPLSNANDVDKAVQAAKHAFREWRETPAFERARCLHRLTAALEDGFDSLAYTLVEEHGKTLDEARGEVRRAIENVEAAAGIPALMMGYNTVDIAAGIDETALIEPVGVFAGITPFNFPILVPYFFLPYAIASGNTYIVKPSEVCPISTTKLFEIMEQADFPPGVIGLVHGAREAADALLAHPDVAGISFVGSTSVGKYIYSTATGHGKRAQCQMGAKNYLVVMPDADIERTAFNILSSVFGNAGQRCLAGSVVVAVGEIHERLSARLVEAAAQIKVGSGLDETVQMGPVVSQQARDRILRLIDKGVEEKADLLLDGRTIEVEGFPDGCFIGPTIFDRVTPGMTIAQEEVFGPVMAITTAGDFEEALAIIDAIPFGNAAAIYTSSGKWAREFQKRVRCGNVGINIGVPAPMATFPLAGMKDSFHGDLHGQGQDAIQFFTDRKVVISRWF